MKKKLVLVLALALAMIAVLAGCGKKSSSSSKKIGVIQLVENGAFNDMRDGILEQMKSKGYDDIEVKCAQGDASALQTIAQNMADGSYDLVFTIATPSTQAMVNLETETPVFFCAVSAPVAAGVITDMEHPDKNATGTSNAIPVSDIFALSNKLTPDVKTYGFIYCTSEDNSVNTAKQAVDYCEEKGIEYKEVSVTTSADVEQGINTLVDQGVDAIFIPNDSVVMSSMAAVTSIAREKKIPVYGSSATMVDAGCFATIAISDTGIGKMTADMALEYLDGGKDIKDIPSIVVPASATVVNKTTVEALGIELSESDDITFVEDAQ